MRALAVLLLAGGLLALGATAAAAQPVTVEIGDRLEPAEVTVPAGGAVTWHNADGERHRVRSRTGPARVDSGNLEPGETYTHTFALPGSYPYVDARDEDVAAYHGTVTVTGAVGGDGSEVAMGEESFVPAALAVPVGATVTWTNGSDDEHTVTAEDGTFDSGELDQGARFAQTFPEPGTFGYLCVLHAGMRGTVTVGDGDAGGQPADGAATADDAAEPGAGAADGAPVEVEVQDFAFAPEAVEVATGTTVSWRMVGGAPHTVTAETGAFDSGVLDPGATFEQTFDEPGAHPYLCSLHPGMTGVVTVTDGADGAGGADGTDGGDGTTAAGTVPRDAAGAPAGDGAPDAGADGDVAAGTDRAGTDPVDGTLVAAPSAAGGLGGAWPALLLLGLGLLSGSVLWGASRIERALRRRPPTPDAPPPPPPDRARP